MTGTRRRHRHIAHATLGVILLSSCSAVTESTDAPQVVDIRGNEGAPIPTVPEAIPAPTTDPVTVATQPTTTLVPLPAVALDVESGPGGFAGTQGLTGGFGQASYVITSTDDAGPGTYRDALSNGGRFIRFDPALDGQVIDLRSPVIVSGSDLTLDGSGVDVVVSGHATRFSGTNVIVAGMIYRDLDTADDADALTFLDASETQVVGLFGNQFADANDGLVDFIWNRGNDVYVTACGNRFERHDKAMLVHSGRDGREGGLYHLTLCRNVWSDVYQRTPLTRDAHVHQYNSVVERYGKPNGDGGGSKAGGGSATQHRLESNVATPRTLGEETFDGATVTEPRSEWAGPHLGAKALVSISGTRLESTGDVTATELEQRPEEVFDPPYDADVKAATKALRDAIVGTAGTCVPAGVEQIIPCAPLVLLGEGGVVSGTVVGDASVVHFELGGAVVEPSTDLGDGRYELAPLLDPGEPTTIRLVATTSDGRSVSSDVAIVAAVG